MRSFFSCSNVIESAPRAPGDAVGRVEPVRAS
jgi:hypothetical protein